jgi:hypothetical protein
MSTQRRENRWQRMSCTERADASRHAGFAKVARYACAVAKGITAPKWLATNSLQLDYPTRQFVRLVHLVRQDIRPGTHSSSPPHSGRCKATGIPATHRSSLPQIPFPSEFANLRPTLPQNPAGLCRWTERYDGKRDLYLQHAA